MELIINTLQFIAGSALDVLPIAVFLFAFQWLVIRKNRLGDAMTAHAITNFLLGLYIIWRGQWQFWG